MAKMRLLGKGAEAELWLSEYDEKPAVYKKRVKKGYRIRELDEGIRRKRVRSEAKGLRHMASYKVPVPKVYAVDEKKHTIVLEYLDGVKLKDAFDENWEIFAEEIGRLVYQVHKSGYIHNDLTTSNLIFVSGKIHLIDLGLGFFSKSVEDRATDLFVFKKILDSSHPAVSEKAWGKILSSYGKHAGAKEVLKRLERVEKRGRYKGA